MFRPRTTDWGLACTVGIGFASGLLSLVSGRAEDQWVFVLHGVAGFWLAWLVVLKLRRVWRRLVPSRASYRDWRTYIGLGTTLLVLLVLGLGIAWTAGGALVVLGYNLLNWHIVFSFALMLLVSLHMLVRAKPLRHVDLAQRRQALRLGGLAVGGVLAWPVQQWAQSRLGLPGAQRRFTGSREAASFEGNQFPTTSWVADNPRPVAAAAWHLVVAGAVRNPLQLPYDAVASGDELTATLDCTGGFYSTQVWHGVRVGTLLDQAGYDDTVRWVRFTSITGYRWSLPLAEAWAALVATHVGGEALSHGHGAPARLVAPGQRGFVWVKWLVAIEACSEPDPGQLLAINTSGFTRAGKGET